MTSREPRTRPYFTHQGLNGKLAKASMNKPACDLREYHFVIKTS
jgi:hypothetical protein